MAVFKEKSKIAVWKRFKDNRKFLEITGGVLFLACLGAIIYLVAVGRTITTNMAIDPLSILAPVLFLEIFIIGGSALRLALFPKKYIIKNEKFVRIIKILQVAVLSLGVIILLYMIIFLNIGFFTGIIVDQYNGFKNVFFVLSIAILACLYVDTFMCVELKSNKLSKKIKAKYPEEEVMNVKQILPRVFEYCGKHYFQMLVVFILYQFIYTLVSVFVLVPIYYSLLNNLNSMAPEDPGAMPLFFFLIVYNIFQFAIEKTFYYMGFTIGIYIVVNSYNGSDVMISEAFKAVKRKAVHFFFLCLLYALLEQLMSILDAMLFWIPGIIFYIYCIMIFPNFIVVKKYRFLENFGKSKDLINKNFTRTILYTGLLITFPVIGLARLMRLPLGWVSETFTAGFSTHLNVADWAINPWGVMGNLLLDQSVISILGVLIGPFEVALISILFIDLSRRKELKIVDAGGKTTAKGKIERSKQLSFEERLSLARYCPNCGLSVKKGLKRCPNCKQRLERD